MKYLIDTNVCLWAVASKHNISAKVTDILENTQNNIFVSQMSYFEIAIKLKTGKLTEFDVSLPIFINAVENLGFEILPIKNEHFFNYQFCDFQKEHRDPFDRYLIATANYEKISFITKDDNFKLYTNNIHIVW